MYKYPSLLLILVLLIFSFGFDSSKSANQSFVVNTNPATMFVNQDELDEVVLDKDEICTPCPPGFRPNEGSDCDINMIVKVFAGKPEDKNFSYKYTVSGGRIIGEGARVSWDLTGAQSGTYEIDVDIRNKLNGFEKKETKAIEVTAQACGGVCDCPRLSVTPPKSPTKAGETMIFTANVSGGSQSDITYNWTISNGKIIEGQGTPSITVATNSKMAGKTVKATVEIGEFSGLCEACLKIESASGSVAKAKRNKQ